MTSRELYKRFTNLCQKWPKDESKVGRDYAEYFRNQLGKHFPHGDLGQVNDAESVRRALTSLERLADNVYYNENALKKSSASGLEAWVCHESISNFGIKQLQDDIEESTLIERLKARLGTKFVKSKLDYKVADEYGGKIKEKDTSETTKQ